MSWASHIRGSQLYYSTPERIASGPIASDMLFYYHQIRLHPQYLGHLHGSRITTLPAADG